MKRCPSGRVTSQFDFDHHDSAGPRDFDDMSTVQIRFWKNHILERSKRFIVSAQPHYGWCEQSLPLIDMQSRRLVLRTVDNVCIFQF